MELGWFNKDLHGFAWICSGFPLDLHGFAWISSGCPLRVRSAVQFGVDLHGLLRISIRFSGWGGGWGNNRSEKFLTDPKNSNRSEKNCLDKPVRKNLLTDPKKIVPVSSVE